MTDTQTKRFSVLTGLKLAASLALGFALLYGVFYLVAPHYHDRRADGLMQRALAHPDYYTLRRLETFEKLGRGTEAGRQRLHEFMDENMPLLIRRQLVFRKIDSLPSNRDLTPLPEDYYNTVKPCHDVLDRLDILPPDDPLRQQALDAVHGWLDTAVGTLLAQFATTPDDEQARLMDVYLAEAPLSEHTAEAVRKALYPYLRKRMEGALGVDGQFVATYFDHPAITGPLKQKAVAAVTANDTALLQRILKDNSLPVSTKSVVEILSHGLVEKALAEKALARLTPRFSGNRAVVGHPIGVVYDMGETSTLFGLADPLLFRNAAALVFEVEQLLGDRWVSRPVTSPSPPGHWDPTTICHRLVQLHNPRTTPGRAEVTLRLHLKVVRRAADRDVDKPKTLYQIVQRQRMTIDVQAKSAVANLRIIRGSSDIIGLGPDARPDYYIAGNLAANRVGLSYSSELRYLTGRIRELPEVKLGDLEQYTGEDGLTPLLLEHLKPRRHRVTLELETDWDIVYSDPYLTQVHDIKQRFPLEVHVTDDMRDIPRY